jgi:hypothetical protein
MTKFVKASTKIAMLVLIGIAALSASAKAQSLGNRIKANIPFDFTVAGKKFAAGKYSIVRVNPTAGDQVLSVSSDNDRSTVLPATIPVTTFDAKDKSTLVFHRIGDEYFLAQVWPAGSTTGRAFIKSRREKQLEQEQRAAATNNKVAMVETVTLVF